MKPSFIDTNAAGHKIDSVPEKQASRIASRYDAIIATFVGVCALFVSGYTAYMQRQQVRAEVWPILEFDSGNSPDIHFTVANKGVGPAIIRNVVVKVDGQPVNNWTVALEKLLGPGKRLYSESDMNGHVLSAGESLIVCTPRDAENNPLVFDKTNPLWVKLNKERERVARNLLLLHARPMLDPAQWCDDYRRHHRDQWLPAPVGHQFSAVVEKKN